MKPNAKAMVDVCVEFLRRSKVSLDKEEGPCAGPSLSSP